MILLIFGIGIVVALLNILGILSDGWFILSVVICLIATIIEIYRINKERSLLGEKGKC